MLQYFETLWLGLQSDIYKTLIQDDRWKLFLEGFGNTLIIALGATVIGIAIGVVVAMIKVANAQTGRWKFPTMLCNLYLTFIRGTPVLVQLLIMYFVIFKSVELDKAIYVAVLAFGINSGAYVAEIIRAGVQSVDRGQAEAGISLGMTPSSTMRLIILPQAIKNVLPAIFNEFIVLLKETSVAGYISIRDLTKAADIVRTRTYASFPALIFIALIYLLLVVGLTKVQQKLERRLNQSDRR